MAGTAADRNFDAVSAANCGSGKEKVEVRRNISSIENMMLYVQ